MRKKTSIVSLSEEANSAAIDASSKRTTAVLELLKANPDLDNSFALHEDGNTLSIHVFRFDSASGDVCELKGAGIYERLSEADFLDIYECRYWKVFGGRHLKPTIS